MSLKNFQNKYYRLYKNNSKNLGYLGLILIALLTTMVFRLFSPKESKEPQVPLDVFEASTFIPQNHTLIPIEIENFEAVNGLIQKYAWVDLYTPENQGGAWKKPIKIVKKIRILRAPLDPNHFGIIVPLSFSETILSYGSVFKVSLVKNSQQKSQLIVHKKTPQQRVFYGN